MPRMRASQTDTVAAKPATVAPTGVLTFPQGPTQTYPDGTTIPPQWFIDLYANLVKVYSSGNVASTRTNDENMLRDAIQGLAPKFGFSLNPISAYNYNLIDGPQPLLRGVVTSVAADVNKWYLPTGLSDAIHLHNADLALDNSSPANRGTTDSVFGDYNGTFNCLLNAVTSTGARGTSQTLSDADRGKAVYLSVTSNTPFFTYSFLEDIADEYKGAARYVGRMIARSGNTATVYFNTLAQDSRTRQDLIWDSAGQFTIASTTLKTGKKFSDYSRLIFMGGRDRSAFENDGISNNNIGTPTANNLIAQVIPVPDFEAGFTVGAQESNAADAFWVVRWVSDTQFRIFTRSHFLSTGIRRVWGVY